MFLLFFLVFTMLSFADDAYLLSGEAFTAERAAPEQALPSLHLRAPISKLKSRSRISKASAIQSAGKPKLAKILFKK